MNSHLGRSVGLSAAAGLLMALSFPLGPPLPPVAWPGWWPLGWICLTPLMLAAVRAASWRRAALCGLVTGFVAFGLILAWIFPFLIRWGRLSILEAAPVFLLLVLYVALHVAAFSCCLQVWARRWGSAAGLVLAPAAWAGLELSRGHLLTGFPWCLLGYSQAEVPMAIQTADLAGVYGVSFLLACGGACAALLLAARERGAWRPRSLGAALALAAVVAAGWAYGAIRLARSAGGEGGVKVALVQANVAQSEKWDPGEADRIERDHVALTREASLRGASLIVWSESSVPLSITRHPDFAARMAALAKETGAEILLGSVAYGESPSAPVPFNSAFLVTPSGGLGPRYDKQHLVPFGEYVPLKEILFFLQPLVQEASDFHPGAGPGVLAAAAGRLGVLICYEAVFPELARACVRAGAGVLVNITNDAWYGDTAMPRQHLAQAAMRAVELRRPLLRCANTGISAIVDPSGRILRRSRLGEQAILEGSIASSDARTVYAAAGDGFAWACVILTTVALALAGVKRSRRPAPPRSEPRVRTTAP